MALARGGDGAKTTAARKRLVAAPGINTNVVNRGAPDLFPVMSLVKKEFSPREGGSAAPSM
jgi:hypothetical protein